MVIWERVSCGCKVEGEDVGRTCWAERDGEGALALLDSLESVGSRSANCGSCVVDFLNAVTFPLTNASAESVVSDGGAGGSGWTADKSLRSRISPCRELRRLVTFVKTGCEFHLCTGAGPAGVEGRSRVLLYAGLLKDGLSACETW